MGVYTATLSGTRSRVSGSAGAPLLPMDGARAAELRNHPRPGAALGEGLARRLGDMPDELACRIAGACEEGPGMP